MANDLDSQKLRTENQQLMHRNESRCRNTFPGLFFYLFSLHELYIILFPNKTRYKVRRKSALFCHSPQITIFTVLDTNKF